LNVVLSIFAKKLKQMVYKVIGLMSGSSLDGLDIAYAELHESGGKWTYELLATDCYAYNEEWKKNLQAATTMNAYDYQCLHTAYGHYMGEQVNQFIAKHQLEHKVQLISSHGHTTFHAPQLKMTGQIGDGAAIAAATQINVVSDLRAMDIAFGGQGAPIVPIGEKLLLGDYTFFLNLGGIANISANLPDTYLAFDTSPANRILNLLIAEKCLEYDAGGQFAATGKVDAELLAELNALDYYQQPFPKSLANDFGTDVLYPMISKANLSLEDKMCTHVEHMVQQIKNAIAQIGTNHALPTNQRLLVCGGGALNLFVIERLTKVLQEVHVEVVVPNEQLALYKEALVMALIGVLRWREEYNVLHTVTGASRSSIGGAVWIGQEA
jgi:anhydro-N-acetylmuramic acid kinase